MKIFVVGKTIEGDPVEIVKQMKSDHFRGQEMDLEEYMQFMAEQIFKFRQKSVSVTGEDITDQSI